MNIESSVDRPYFARIDFKFDDNDEIKSYYIGRHGISHDSDILITDWRAPISSLYYDCDLGKCSFEGPYETLHGEMFLKRQFEIDKGNLIEYFDVDLVASDQLLQKYLNTNNDSRLKSIVATIQQEQNDVIRRKISENLIIQGVAGSGKTTVALHRIAYLVYNYLKSVNQGQYLVIGPNPVFIKYVKSVLPDLDVSGVSQYTYEQLAQMYIEEDLNINSSEKKVASNIAGKLTHDIDKFKSSMMYMQMIKQFINTFMMSLTSKDLTLGDFVVVDSNTITKVFNNSNDLIMNYSLDSIIERTINSLTNYVKDNLDKISPRYGTYSSEIFKTAKTDDEKDKLRSKFHKEREELEKGCRSTIRKYFSKSKVDVTKLYKLFISTIENFNFGNYEYINELKNVTMKNIKNNTYDFEDLAALMFIKKCIAPNRKYKDIRHTVVDESQDLGGFIFYVMKECLPSSTFSIFGDLAQSIYDYRGIDNWDVVNSIMFNGDGKIINFAKSYRTTSEIMETADDVAEYIGQRRSELVVRHGKDVSVSSFDNEYDIPLHIIDKIKEYKEKGYKTIAIISKTDLLSRYINDDLSDIGFIIPNVTIEDDLSDERFNICTISNQLAKGLEFDAVIINNAGEHIYSSDNKLDMKLLYVAITRALHELDVAYTGELVKPLQRALNRQK